MRLSPERPFARLLKTLVEGMLQASLRRSLRGVYLRGEVPPGPLVLAMNHHSYFDGHLVWFLGKRHRHSLSLLVAEENLKAFPVLALAGALEAGQVREALRRLARGEWVAVFPEGAMRYPAPWAPCALGPPGSPAKLGCPSSPWPAGWPCGASSTPRPSCGQENPLPPRGTWRGPWGSSLPTWTASWPKPTPGRCQKASGKPFGGGGAWRSGCGPWWRP
ncbi:1-acyl-sn-glycerol-3-phosphate acyltransferase [Thermus caliditerrae]|uniref:1-acyl-sn-glycerol-3-phosphate acyltransferase n=1 Tax=Thermus caliditerrae TaxID=1330700 RepID=UPI000A6C0909|nr:1-acyl-sn-glycerol-3-phosphate acyltransferase [Thermus caliditerrae]